MPILVDDGATYDTDEMRRLIKAHPKEVAEDRREHKSQWDHCLDDPALAVEWSVERRKTMGTEPTMAYYDVAHAAHAIAYRILGYTRVYGGRGTEKHLRGIEGRVS